MKNVHIDKDIGLFIGSLVNNRPNRHYAFQISLSTGSPLLILNDRQEEFKGTAFFINSKVTHQLECEAQQLTVLINPLSLLGHKLYLKYGHGEIIALNDTLSVALTKLLNTYGEPDALFTNLTEGIREVFKSFENDCTGEEPFNGDHRIMNALHYLDQHFSRLVSLKEISDVCCLSETRFLHLF